MHILAFILIFVVCSIIAACDGDYSGIAAIGKFVGFFVYYSQYYGYLPSLFY